MLAVSVVGIAQPVAGDGGTTEGVKGAAHRTLVTDWDAVGTQAFSAAVCAGGRAHALQLRQSPCTAR